MTSLNFLSHPVQPLKGEIQVPGDKSISHRSLILGAIAKGTTTITGFLTGEDCLRTLLAFQMMGVDIEGPTDNCVIVHGVGKYGLKAPKMPIDCGNSGTSIRLLAGLLAAQSFDSVLTGDESLQKRPMARVSTPLMQMGAKLETHDGCPPIKIKGGHKLTGIHYPMPIASAQVKSCLLLAGLYAEGDTEIIEPGPSRDHTERMLKTFSYPIQKSAQGLVINSASDLIATDITIPGDISSAAFFIVAATIIPGSILRILNVGINPTRTGVIEILTQMGAKISYYNKRKCGEEDVADLLVEAHPLVGIHIPESLVPKAIDEFPIIMIAAACAKGKTTITGASELRAKESDRIQAMVTGLNVLGIKAQAFDDGAEIEGGVINGGVVESFSDHRVAMSFAIAGAIATKPVLIKNCHNVATSFPSFIATGRRAMLNIEEITDVN